jgi:Fe-S cluster assembly iron-binding protein IscA
MSQDPIEKPLISLSADAARQIQLIQQHDYTLEGQLFRIKIGGKGCGGFTYELGFSTAAPDDFVINVDGVELLMDRFTAFYVRRARLDHRFDAESGEEGFVLENQDEALYAGKFFKDTTMVPPWEKQ